MTSRSAVLELDDAAFEWQPPNARVSTMLAWRVGHFAVHRAPNGLHVSGMRGDVQRTLDWIVAHIASGSIMLDFATMQRAWEFADEISRACGERLEHEPRDVRAFCEAVPDVVAWVQWLAKLSQHPGAVFATGERPFHRIDDWAAARFSLDGVVRDSRAEVRP